MNKIQYEVSNSIEYNKLCLKTNNFFFDRIKNICLLICLTKYYLHFYYKYIYNTCILHINLLIQHVVLLMTIIVDLLRSLRERIIVESDELWIEMATD